MNVIYFLLHYILALFIIQIYNIYENNRIKAMNYGGIFNGVKSIKVFFRSC